MARLAGIGSSYRIRVGDTERLVTVTAASPDGIDLEIEGNRYRVQIEPVRTTPTRTDGVATPVALLQGEATSRERPTPDSNGAPRQSPAVGPAQAPANASTPGVSAPMPGVVVALPVQVGERVDRGAIVAVIEAMKMENSIVSTRAGVVREIHVSIGREVERGQALVSLESIE